MLLFKDHIGSLGPLYLVGSHCWLDQPSDSLLRRLPQQELRVIVIDSGLVGRCRGHSQAEILLLQVLLMTMLLPSSF